MSDHGRRDFTDKAEAKLKPDSQKTTTEHFGDKFKGTADSVGSALEPQGEKSTTQKMGDAFTGDNTNKDERTFTQKAKDAVGLGGHH